MRPGALAPTLERTRKEISMILKRTSLVFAAAIATVVAVGAASAASTPGHASLLIRHQMRGCHTWSVNGGSFKASQAITLRRDGRLAVTNNDVMPHKLVQTSGPTIQFAHANLAHIG